MYVAANATTAAAAAIAMYIDRATSAAARRRRRRGRRQASLMEGKKERPVRRPRRKPSLNLNSTLTQLNSLRWPCCALPWPCYCAVATCNEMKANSGYISLLVVLHVAMYIGMKAHVVLTAFAPPND